MRRLCAALVTVGVPFNAFAETAPIGKVLSMVSDLQATLIHEGEKVQREYAEFAAGCEDRSRILGFELQTDTGEVERLQAAIAEEAATLGSLKGAALAANSADLKAASAVRSKEAAVFSAEEQEVMETIDTLGRASSILEREVNKGSSSLLQSRNAGNLADTFNVLVRASMIGTSEAAKLASLVQDAQRAKQADEDQAPGAPAAAVYESQSGGTVDKTCEGDGKIRGSPSQA